MAKPEQSQPPLYTIVQLVKINETGDSYYRMRWPGATLAKQRPSWRVVNLDAQAAERYELARQADLLVLYQNGDLDLLPIIEERRRRGKKTLAEYNDNFYEPQLWSPVAKEWSSPLVWQSYELLMEAVDGVLVTGVGLEQLLAQRLPRERIHILENHLPFVPEPQKAARTGAAAAELRLGWAGSLGHMADLLAVAPLLRELVQRLPLLRIHLMGNAAIPDLLNLPPDRLRFTPWGTMQQYYDFLRQLDVAIAPLNDTAYNRCRSDIKAVEIAAFGVAPLLPNALPYREFLRETKLRPVADLRDLSDRITAYASDRSQLAADAEVARSYVAQRRVDRGRSERVELYEALLPSAPTRPAADFLPGVAPGYHELTGTLSPAMPTGLALAEASEALRRRDGQAALRTVERITTTTNPRHPDAQLALIRLLSQVAPVEQRIAAAVAAFPRDLRFLMVRAQLAKSLPEREKAWAGLLLALETAEPASRRFFRADVLRLLTPELERFPSLLPVGERALGLYPTSVPLRMALADRHARSGDPAKALAHFQWLTAALDEIELNREPFDPLHAGYAAAFREALEAYLAASKS